MNRRYLSLLSPLCLALSASFLAPHAQAQVSRVDNELLVRWSSQPKPLVLAPGVDASPWQQQSLKAQVSAKLPGASVTRTFTGSGWSLISVPSGLAGDATKARLAQALGTANITYNYRRQIAAKTPNDPEYTAQWQWAKVKAPDAWGLNTGAATTVVAVLDTGVDLVHPDLRANLWVNKKEIAGNGKDDDGDGYIDDVYGYNAVKPGTAPQDDNGHGTHCAGLIGAVGNNKTNVTGACWTVKIMALKFLDANGGGEDANAIACLEYAVKMKKSGVNLRVISNSWSGPEDNPALKAAFQLAENAGILNVCAAGNGIDGAAGRNTDTSPEYPASYTLNSILSVAASDQNDALASFSNYGAKSVDLAAPGAAILSLRNGGGTREDSGTSMAAPIVAGAAALLATREPSLTAAQLKARLIGTVDAVPALKGKVISGGRLNMGRTLTNATMQLSGSVYRLDGTTKVYLTGALIAVNGKTVTSSGTGGKYLITDIAPSTLTVTCVLKGFTFASKTLVMPQPSGTTGAPNGVADFPSTKADAVRYTLSGHATDANGKVQKNVSIFISGVPNAVAVTDSLGKYKIVDRGAGTYKLTATSPSVIWTPDLASITVPTKSTTVGAPNGTVNFTATVPDTAAPAVIIKSPVDGSTIAPSTPTASGTATDATGSSQLFFELNRLVDFDFSYYDWTKKAWTTDSNAPGIIGSKSASGTAVNWTQALPALTAGSYSLRVWGSDILGNESNGSADAVTSFTVASAVKAAQKATTNSAPSAPKS